jgi:hypothetical protein
MNPLTRSIFVLSATSIALGVIFQGLSALATETVVCPEGTVYRSGSENKCQPINAGDFDPGDIGRPEGTQGSGTR